MINAYRESTETVVVYTTGRRVRFNTVEEIKDYFRKYGWPVTDMFYQEEDEAEATYYDVMDALDLALKPHVERVLTEDVIREIKHTVEDAVQNNVFN